MDRRGALKLGVGRLEVVNPVDPLVAGDLQRPLKFPESNELKLEEVGSGHPCSLVPVSRVSTCKEARHGGGTKAARYAPGRITIGKVIQMLVCKEDGEIVHEDANACFFA